MIHLFAFVYVYENQLSKYCTMVTELGPKLAKPKSVNDVSSFKVVVHEECLLD